MRFTNAIIIFSSLSSLGYAKANIKSHDANPEIDCPLEGASVSIPPNQVAISVPAGQTTSYVAIGRGIQNYSCSAAGTWTSTGAVAQLFDVSCLSNLPSIPAQVLPIPFDPHPNAPCTLSRLRRARRDTTLSSVLSSFCSTSPLDSDTYLGFHSFVTPAGGALSPKFDFTQSQQDGSAYILAKKTGSTPSPVNPAANVAWLELAANDAAGTLAVTAFRTDTAGGQPPAGNCGAAGGTTSVNYAALYWFLDD